MRDHSRHIQASREEALEIILAHVPVMGEAETVPVATAHGRVLAEDACSQWDAPNVLTCALDSVAVHWKDFAQGMPDTSGWIRGRDWDFANTGVAMPAGFDAAIPVEQVDLSDDDTRVTFRSCPKGPFDGTIAPGSRRKTGDVLATAGTLLTPSLAAHVASGNNTHVTVRRRPVVAFLPTGSELVPPGEAPVATGKNVESTSLAIAGKVTRWGGEPLVWDIVEDRREAIREAILAAVHGADILVLNAGSSRGSDDWAMEVLEELGRVYYHQVDHGPGHHSSFALVEGTPVVGLSGPPDGGVIAADLYLYPAIQAALGLDPRPKRVKARLMDSFEKSRSKSGRKKERRYVSGAFHVIKQMRLALSAEGLLEAWPPASSHLSPPEAEEADAYYLLNTAEGAAEPRPGELIEVELKPR